MDKRVAGCQRPVGATPLLTFGLPSPPGVVGMVMAPGSASGKHPFNVVCKCGLGCCVCGGRRVGVGVWGLGLLVMLHVRALFVGGGGCVWVKCPCGGSGPHPVLGIGLVLVLAAGGLAVCRCCCGTLLCFALLHLCAACYRVLASFIVCLCRLWPVALRCVLCCLRVVRYAASVRGGGRGYPGRAAPAMGAEFGETPKRLDRAAQPLAGPSPSPGGLPLGLAREPCLWAAVAVLGCTARVVGLAPTLGIGCWAGAGACGTWCGCPPPSLSLGYTALLCFAILCVHI